MPTLLLIPSLYVLGWLIVQPLLILFEEISKSDISLIGTIVTFFLFLLVLPDWIRYRFNNSRVWIYIGINNKLNSNIFFFLRGLLIALALLLIILAPLILFQSEIIIPSIELDYFLNAILLGCGVGFAEELIFRGWLLEEMKYLFGHRLGMFLQAFIFSISHIRFNMDLQSSFSLLFGLFLLGIILGIRRKMDSGSLWGAIGMHGGLVGGWFLINTLLAQVNLSSSIWMKASGVTSSNPIGGGLAIIVMILIIFYQRKEVTRF
tara:strand:+ start:5864 stop:6652 length:789 start_codon:yes stop_codon:yes gene_type:complete